MTRLKLQRMTKVKTGEVLYHVTEVGVGTGRMVLLSPSCTPHSRARSCAHLVHSDNAPQYEWGGLVEFMTAEEAEEASAAVRSENERLGKLLDAQEKLLEEQRRIDPRARLSEYDRALLVFAEKEFCSGRIRQVSGGGQAFGEFEAVPAPVEEQLATKYGLSVLERARVEGALERAKVSERTCLEALGKAGKEG